VFEHWSMNIHNVHLSDPDVREALAYAIDKGVVMSELYTPIYGDALPAEGNGGTYWLAGSDNYIDHQGDAGYGQGDLDSAAELLEGAGYELNADDIYEHPERGPLTLRIATTGGNELRELQQQLLQNQLAEGGFDIEIDNRPGADHFTEQAFSPGNVACSVSGGDQGATVTLQSGEDATADCEVVDIVQFAWVGGPWPGGQNVAYRSGSENNPHGYANPEVDALMDQCDATVDDAERADCYHEIDRHVTTREVDPDGLVIIPLTVKPSFYAYSNTTLERAVTVVDANDAGPLVHGADYLPAG
jgi:peptide/nickel transport system substrate-binding protein